MIIVQAKKITGFICCFFFFVLFPSLSQYCLDWLDYSGQVVRRYIQNLAMSAVVSDKVQSLAQPSSWFTSMT